VSCFHSAFIAKFWLDEPESEAIRALAESLGEVHRKWREGAFSAAAFREVSDQFSDDCAASLWHWLPLSASLAEAAARAIRRMPRTVFLRSADALHLTCAREHGFRSVYSNDRRVLAAARYFKLKGINVAA